MKVKIRKFRNEDVIKAGNVVKRAQRITLKKFYSKKVIEYFCVRHSPKNLLERAKERQFYVAEKNRKIVGVMALKDNELKTFFVDPSYHGKGIGRKLFEVFRKESLKNGYKKVFVYSSINAVPVYKSLGFRRIKKVKIKKENGIKYDVMLMKQTLK